MEWNAAVCEAFFPELPSPAPVYLDFEEDKLAILAEQTATPVEKVIDSLAHATRTTLDLTEGPNLVFSGHREHLSSWRQERSREASSCDPPPVLGLLAVLSATAESMRHGDGMSDTNYYGRLAQVLGISEHKELVAAGYRKVAEPFWRALNDWLVGLDGLRGLPTAYALQHRYVGLPLSQALVRHGDRERLISFFQSFGLSPGSDVPPAEMRVLLTAWMSRRPCPATKTLESLWNRPTARLRIAQTAAVALAAWDGTLPRTQGAEGGATSRAMLLLELGTFPKKRFSLGVLVSAAEPLQARRATILSSSDQVAVTLHPAGSGVLSLGDEVSLDPATLLEGSFTLTDSLSQSQISRRPRRAVPFKQDPLSQRWVEADQVLLADNIRIVAHEDLVERLEKTLEQIARPGWSRLDSSFPGVPDSWSVFKDVEVLGHPGGLVSTSRMDDLGFLVPITNRQVRIDGGFKLPGSIRNKWHAGAPPEVKAVSDAPGGVSVRVVQFDEQEDTEVVVVAADDPSGILVIDLEEHDLPSGAYRVDLLEDNKPTSSTHFYLATGSQPDTAQWNRIERVDYETDRVLGILGVQGGPAATSAPVSTASCPEVTWWEGAVRRRAASAPLRVALPDPASCIYTGRHVEVIESPRLDRRGRPVQSTVEGRCQGCGLVRRYSTNYYTNRRRYSRRSHQVESSEIRPVSGVRHVREPSDTNWDLLLDALFHVGGGTWESFERIAMQIEPTGIFVDHASRLLEALGHLNVKRDPESIRPVTWEVPETRLDVSPGEYATYLGYWPDTLSNVFFSEAAELGASTEYFENPNGPATWFSRPLSALDGLDVPLDGAGRRILDQAPALSSVARALPRRPDQVSGSVTRFDPQSASWVDSESIDGLGGFRIRRFGALDIIRTEEDLRESTIAISTVQLSKHIAALVTGAPPLVAYSRESQELRVPKGADLPGLLGRAAVSFSGREPQVMGRSLVYTNVPDWAADRIYAILSN